MVVVVVVVAVVHLKNVLQSLLHHSGINRLLKRLGVGLASLLEMTENFAFSQHAKNRENARKLLMALHSTHFSTRMPLNDATLSLLML